MEQKDQGRVWARQLGLFSVIVSELLVTTGVGVGIGYWIWKKWNGPFWAIIVTTSASLALAMYRVYRLFQKEIK